MKKLRQIMRKPKEKMEASKARYEADLKRFKAAEIAKQSGKSGNCKNYPCNGYEYSGIGSFQKRMKNELPGRVEIQKEETKADDESGKNETEEENNY